MNHVMSHQLTLNAASMLEGGKAFDVAYLD